MTKQQSMNKKINFGKQKEMVREDTNHGYNQRLIIRNGHSLFNLLIDKIILIRDPNHINQRS